VAAAAAGTWLGLACGPALAYDAAADFDPQTVTNPNGVWSYGYDPAGNGYQFKPFDLLQICGGTTLLCWNDSTYIFSNTPWVGKNIGSTPVNTVLPGQMGFHPGPTPYEDDAILRFTAPSTGQYEVWVQMFRGDAGGTDGWIVLNGDFTTPLASLGHTDFNPVYHNALLVLHAGDTLDAVVGNQGSYFGDSTPLNYRISLVPEPGAPVLLLAGLAFCGLAAWRRGWPARRDSNPYLR
jgi:hypothetical protein